MRTSRGRGGEAAMEYVDWESRPRLLFRAGAAAAPKLERRRPSAIHAAACLSAAAILLFSSFYLVQSQACSFLLVWIALSLLLGPFAPPSLTGGDPRVGRGPPLPAPSEPHPPLNTDPKKQRQKIRSTHPLPAPVPAVGSVVSEGHRFQDPIPNGNGSAEESKEEETEEEWTEEDFEILKKRISRHPAGEPRRWERITEAFNGRHSIGTVIEMAKSLSEKKTDSGDSYTQFLKHRKPLDKRLEAIDQESSNDGPFGLENGGDLKKESWSKGEDLALLKALKAFPKDAPMRWEKIAAAVPGKSKAGCMKRVAELKKDFRSSKASES